MEDDGAEVAGKKTSAGGGVGVGVWVGAALRKNGGMNVLRRRRRRRRAVVERGAEGGRGGKMEGGDELMARWTAGKVCQGVGGGVDWGVG